MPKMFNLQGVDTCNDCGTTIPAEAAFCTQCGASQMPQGRPGVPATGSTQPLVLPPDPPRNRPIGWEHVQAAFAWFMVLILVLNILAPLLIPQPKPIFSDVTISFDY